MELIVTVCGMLGTLEPSYTPPGGGGTPYNGLYEEAPPERGTFSGFKYEKGQGFHKLRYIKGWGNQSFRYLKGPLIIIFLIDAPEGCRSSFIKHYMKTRTRLSKIGM